MKEKLRFVVHEHHARKLHWDLRLEMKGVLKSWAVPKGPPTIYGVKRLAVQVDDHALEYLEFEGRISEGYGAGEVKIWDKGTYEPLEINEDKISVIFHGEKLKGKYVLLKTKYKGQNTSWLLFKSKSQ